MAMCVLLFVVFHWQRLLLLVKLHYHFLSRHSGKIVSNFINDTGWALRWKWKSSPAPSVSHCYCQAELLLSPGSGLFHLCAASAAAAVITVTSLVPVPEEILPWVSMCPGNGYTCVHVWGGQAYCSGCMLLSPPVQVLLLCQIHKPTLPPSIVPLLTCTPRYKTMTFSRWQI